MRTTLNRTLSNTLIPGLLFAMLTLAGCERLLPTEPEDPFLTSEAFAADGPKREGFEGLGTGAQVVESVPAGSSRTRPVRPSGSSGTPSAEPNTPPPPPVNYDCIGPCDGVVRVPPPSESMAAIYAARDRVRSAVASGEIKAGKKVKDWNVVPSIKWEPCFFWVENGFYYDAQGNRIVGACAAGMTDWKNNRIVISTKEESRTIALVKWEATNYYLYLIDRRDLLDRFQ